MNLSFSVIRESYEEMSQIQEQALKFFFDTLYKQHPEIRNTIEVNCGANRDLLFTQFMSSVLARLDQSDERNRYLKNVGGACAARGVGERQYAWVGKSLLTTLRHFFGKNWTSELERHWVLFIGLVAESMLDGAKEVNQALSLLQLAYSSEKQELSQLARRVARGILAQALEHEVVGDFRRLAQTKAHHLLTQALLEEASCAQSQIETHLKQEKQKWVEEVGPNPAFSPMD
ncbi:MAG: hypothetical protein ACO3A2_09975 [Bdellovibrionia bacterium]